MGEEGGERGMETGERGGRREEGGERDGDGGEREEGGERDGDGGERGEEGGERDGDGGERGEDGSLREEGIKSSRVCVTLGGGEREEREDMIMILCISLYRRKMMMVRCLTAPR